MALLFAGLVRPIASGCFVHSRVRDHQREKGTAQQQQTFPSNKLAAHKHRLANVYGQGDVQIWNPLLLLFTHAFVMSITCDGQDD